MFELESRSPHLSELGGHAFTNMKILTYMFAIALFFVLSACTGSEEEVLVEEEPAEQEIVKVVYVDWESEITSTHVVKEVIENRLGYTCEILSVSVISLWESVAVGEQDAMVAAWLPSLQGQYLSAVEDDVVFLGPNLEDIMACPNDISGRPEISFYEGSE